MVCYYLSKFLTWPNYQLDTNVLIRAKWRDSTILSPHMVSIDSNNKKGLFFGGLHGTLGKATALTVLLSLDWARFR